MKNSAIVIGNGVSRKGFNFHKLSSFDGMIVGCNLTYLEDFKPDLTVAIDDEAIKLVMKNVPIHRVLIPPEQERLELNGSGRRSNAGMNAILEAIKRGYRKVYCFGFDSFLEAEPQTTTSNVHADNPLYQGPRQATTIDNQFRIEYLVWFANYFHDVQLVFVYPDEMYRMVTNVGYGPNVSTITFKDFLDQGAK